jgi:beta-N-acetylglucosaminidase
MRSAVAYAMTLAVVLTFATAVAAQEPLLRIPGAQFGTTDAGARQAGFTLEKLPAGPLFIHLKLKAASTAAAAVEVDVRLNEQTIFQGPAALSSDYWRFKRYEVKAGSLRVGANMLEVAVAGRKAGAAAEPAFEAGEAFLSDRHFAPTLDLMTDFEVELPARVEPYPARLTGPDKAALFKIRGTKGWAWTPEQYLAEVPYLAKAKMNFLMNCYTSLFTSINPFVNRWWEPLPEDKKKGFEAVVRACRENGIEFCFAVHPGLFSERPLAPGNARDFEDLWQHYAWMQGLGVKWFSVSYDDIGVEGLDKAQLGTAHAELVNKLLDRLREKDSQAQLIFCPVYYMGCGDTQDGQAYFGGLSRVLASDVYIFWTGDAVVPPRITMKCASIYGNAAGHRLILWDNYPVNDRNPTLHLGPVAGRPADLPRLVDGYMGNPLCPQSDINRIPLFTEADYSYNPEAYDPLRSIGKAILHLADSPARRQALKHLVELYPGNLLYGDSRTSFNPVLERFRLLMAKPQTRRLAEAFAGRVASVEKELGEAFPGQYESTRETVRGHIAEMKKELGTGQ